MFIFGCGNKCDSGRPSLRGGGGTNGSQWNFSGRGPPGEHVNFRRNITTIRIMVHLVL